MPSSKVKDTSGVGAGLSTAALAAAGDRSAAAMAHTAAPMVNSLARCRARLDLDLIMTFSFFRMAKAPRFTAWWWSRALQLLERLGDRFNLDAAFVDELQLGCEDGAGDGAPVRR